MEEIKSGVLPIKKEGKKSEKQNRLDMLQASFQAALGQEELFSKIIDFFPYPIEVYAQDGTTVMVNNAILTEFNIASKDMVIGKYNIRQDPDIIKYGLLPFVERIYAGETVYLTDLKVPLQSIKDAYSTEEYAFDAMYQDATGFPIKDSTGKVTHIVMLLISRRIYRGKESIIKAQEYFETNYDAPYDINEAARAANLSPYHFSRLFKSETGQTPYQYYTKIKVARLMDKLLDTNLTVAEAFEACGLDYSGHFAQVFKKHVGYSPSKYREMMQRK